MDYWFLLRAQIIFMRKICIFIKTFSKTLFYIYDKISNVCFHEVPHYYDKELQFVMLWNIWHHNNTMVFSFPKRVMKGKIAGDLGSPWWMIMQARPILVIDEIYPHSVTDLHNWIEMKLASKSRKAKACGSKITLRWCRKDPSRIFLVLWDSLCMRSTFF